MIKNRSELILDHLYRFKKKYGGIDIPHASDRYKKIPAKYARQIINRIFDDELIGGGYSKLYPRNWSKESSNLFLNNIFVTTIESFLPSYIGVDPHVSLSSPELVRLLQKYSSQDIQQKQALFDLRLANFYPRKEDALMPLFDLGSYADEDAFSIDIKNTAKCILLNSNSFFSLFATYSDLLALFSSESNVWPESYYKPFLFYKEEITGLLYLIQGEKEKSKRYFISLITTCEKDLSCKNLKNEEKQQRITLIDFSHKVLSALH